MGKSSGIIWGAHGDDHRGMRLYRAKLRLALKQGGFLATKPTGTKCLVAPCVYCHYWFAVWQLTLDHVLPLGLAGRNHFNNIVLACYECNQEKGQHGLDWIHPKYLEFLKETSCPCPTLGSAMTH